MAFWRTFFHITWATKERQAWLGPEIDSRLYAYLVSKAGELGCYVYAVNGWHDHVHMVLAIPPRLAVADVVKHLKGASSRFLNQVCGFDGGFAWQRGYGVLSLGEKQRPVAEAYVANQKTHHAERNTNAWLERDGGGDEIDDGPEPETSSAAYSAEGSSPF